MKATFRTKSLAALILLALLVFGVTTPALAFTPRSGNTVIIKEGEVIDDDLYVGGNSVVIQGTVKGDVIAFGTLVKIDTTGVVEGDLLAAGQGVVIEGVVKGDVRFAGMALVIGQGAQLGEDMIGFGYSLDMQPETRVGQDAVVAAGVASLRGEIARNLNAAAEGLELDGKIGGDVVAEVGSGTPTYTPTFAMRSDPGVPQPISLPGGLTVGSSAQIAGNLTYSSERQGSIPSGVVTGKTTYQLPVRTQDGSRNDGAGQPARVETPADRYVSWMLGFLRNLAALLLIGFVMAYFFPALLRESADTLQAQPLLSLGWGVVVFVGFFFALALLFFLVLFAALTLGVITLGNLVWTTLGLGALAFTSLTVSFHLAVSYVSKIIVGYLIGRWLFGQFRSELRGNMFWPVVTGILFFALVASVPVLGWIANLLVVLWGLGALFLMLRARYREGRSAALVAQPQG